MMFGVPLVVTATLVVIGLSVAPSALAAPCDATNIRWASSSNTIYVSGASTVCTLTELDVLADKAPITLVDPANKVWFVGANIVMQQGARLNLHGSEGGGDVDELRLRSDSAVVFLRAYWGTIDIRDTKIISWSGSGVDTNHSDKRAYIQVKSFLDGATARESTMNIANSEIGYLGFNGAESYGLSWKVLGSSAGLFDTVGVNGSVTNTHIHHNYFGAYTWGADAMEWRDNEIAHNVVYGLDPHDNSDNLVIENNLVHHNGSHGIICSRFCDHLTIRSNISRDNGGNGIMLHRLTDFSVVEDNDVYNNADTGIAVFDSHHNTIVNNRSHGNSKGMRFSVGSSDNIIRDNIIFDNETYGIYFYKGSDLPTNPGDGKPRRNQFIHNHISQSGIYGLKMKDAEDNEFIDNHFIDNQSLLVELSKGNKFDGNTIRDHGKLGLVLSGATDHIINKNLIQNNGDTGIYLKNGSHRTRITNNIIRDHDDYGILVKNSNNTFIDTTNTFANNGKNVSGATISN